jgi:protoporphyrinogen oxidase
VFRFPKHGGTGAIWKGVAALLPKEKQHYGAGCAVTSVDADARRLTLASGQSITYKSLISTMPLDLLLRMLGKAEWADGLTHSSSHIIGVGIRGSNPHTNKCWLYFPEDNCPFYRATVFSHYADANCPSPDVALPTLCAGDGSPAPSGGGAQAGPYWSLMFEVSESFMKPVKQDMVTVGGRQFSRVLLDCLTGAIATGLMTAGDQVVSLYHRRLEHGYPTPSLGRDAVLAQALPWLRQRNIWSRGRFGSYKYEVANQDHSLMLGVECADNVMSGTMEVTLNYPNIVNGMRNTELRYTR